MSLSRELLWLRRIRDVCHLLAAEREPAKLLPMILDAAIELTEAERGFLVLLRETGSGPLKIKVEVARGFDRYTLRGPQGSVSRTVVQRVIDRGRGLVTAESDVDVLNATSVRERRVLSILCVPLNLRGDTRGVVYLDHRFTKGAFSEDELPVLQTFADQAALALETVHRERAPAPAPAPAPAQEGAPQERADSLRQLGGLLGSSPAMQAMYREIEIAARSWDPVLMVGEPGSGQGLVARELHARGERADAPFVSARSGSLADNAFEGQGHGAPGGAGLLRRAGAGTLFLEEIEFLPRRPQEALLRLLSRRSGDSSRSGGHPSGDCRVVTAAGPGLRAAVEAGEFRADLYYRLDVMRVAIPPLRSRPEDILALYTHFARQARGRAPSLSGKAKELLVGYSWPGNVAELREEAVRLVSSGRARISARQLPDRIREGRGVSRAGAELAGKTLEQVEREMIEGALQSGGGNKAQAARQLGIPRGTFYHLLKRHGL